MRREAPVFLAVNAAWVTRYRDVETALKDNRRFASGGRVRIPAFEREYEELAPEDRARYDEIQRFTGHWLTRVNEPDHSRLRAVERHAFLPKVVAAAEPRIQARADRMLDQMAEKEVAEVVGDLAYAFPLAVVCELIGVPEADMPHIFQISRSMGDRFNPRHVRRAHADLMEFKRYVGELVRWRRGRSDPPTDLLGALVLAADSHGRLSEEELLAMLQHLLFAAHETTAALLGTGLYTLLRHRDQWRMVCDDPGLLPNAIDELLRFETPGPYLDRLVTEDTELGGVPIPKGHSAWLLIGSANRDPQQFPDPDRLDIRRDASRIASFGLGPHYCLGAPMARLEARVVFGTISRRFPNLELAGEVEWMEFRPRWLERLPVRLRVSAG
jgi:cytochrome P450